MRGLSNTDPDQVMTSLRAPEYKRFGFFDATSLSSAIYGPRSSGTSLTSFPGGAFFGLLILACRPSSGVSLSCRGLVAGLWRRDNCVNDSNTRLGTCHPALTKRTGAFRGIGFYPNRVAEDDWRNVQSPKTAQSHHPVGRLVPTTTTGPRVEE